MVERPRSKKTTHGEDFSRNILAGGAALIAAAAVGATIAGIKDKAEKTRNYAEYAAKNPETLKARHLLGEVDAVVKRDGWTIEMRNTVKNMISFYLSGGSKEEQAQKLGFLSGELVMNMDHISAQAKDVAEEIVRGYSREAASSRDAQ